MGKWVGMQVLDDEESCKQALDDVVSQLLEPAWIVGRCMGKCVGVKVLDDDVVSQLLDPVRGHVCVGKRVKVLDGVISQLLSFFNGCWFGQA